MTITLNHTIVPARDKVAAAKFFARLFGLKRARTGHFAPVPVNKDLTLLFDDDTDFDSHHLAFHVTDREFNAILGRVKKAEIEFGSAPWSLDDGKLNDWGAAAAFIFAIRTARAGIDDRSAVTWLCTEMF
jgi:catechol 2,3-dioxygenase-like lactoylglutathione lyase family enzyme